MAEFVHLSVKIYGRVQGVFFRYFVQNMANNWGLNGYVRNLPSGDAVEVEAEGDREKLDRLLKELKLGPPGARVKEVEIKWLPYSGQFTDFHIRY